MNCLYYVPHHQPHPAPLAYFRVAKNFQVRFQVKKLSYTEFKQVGDEGFFKDDWYDDYEDENEVESDADSAHLPDQVFTNYDQGQASMENAS